MHPITRYGQNGRHLRDLRAEAARERLVAQARSGRPAAPANDSATPRARFVLAYARYALTSLAAVAFGWSPN
jgi:hypothetical protein